MSRVHSASCGGTGAWPFASGRPTTAAGLEIITRVIRAARNFQNLDRFPQMSLLLCRALAALGKTSAGQICAVRAGCVVGPVCEYQDLPLCPLPRFRP